MLLFFSVESQSVNAIAIDDASSEFDSDSSSSKQAEDISRYN